ncbi:hypothetical protein D1007_62168 [Hordeum vulgare]|nr:hypothetical protein D1007_62168 [Hordeum vulgare]
MGRTGLARRVIIHLERVEDFSPDADGKILRRPCATKSFQWRRGVVDGQIERREVAQPPASDSGHGRWDDDHNRRRDEDDEDRRGREEGRSWAARLFRSRSRAAPPTEGRHLSGRSMERHRSDRRRDEDRKDRRRDVPDRRKIDYNLVQRLPGGCVIPASGRRPAGSPPAARAVCEVARPLARPAPPFSPEAQFQPAPTTWKQPLRLQTWWLFQPLVGWRLLQPQDGSQGAVQVQVAGESRTPSLFTVAPTPLLLSSPKRLGKERRKTMAGMEITRGEGDST